MKEKLIYIGIIIVLTFLLALSVGKKPKTVEKKVFVTETIKVRVRDTTYVPKPVVVIKADTVILRSTDTVYVYNDYYKTRTYRDTLRSRSNSSYLYLYEKVSQNMISDRYYNFYESNLNITRTIEKDRYIEKPHIYFDITATTNMTDRVNFYLGLTFKSRYKGIYSVGYDPINKSYMGKAGFKIF